MVLLFRNFVVVDDFEVGVVVVDLEREDNIEEVDDVRDGEDHLFDLMM